MRPFPPKAGILTDYLVAITQKRLYVVEIDDGDFSTDITDGV
jgi:hypothetical protein